MSMSEPPRMNLREILDQEILFEVQRPSQYLGSEYNAVAKPLSGVDVRIGLVFPDFYDMGLGNLGLLVLYGILNDLPWCWAERAYAPAPDMEQALRQRGLPLFLVESKDSLASVDAIGFTLQSELTYSNVLNVLDLAGLPLRSQHRGDMHPLVMAGGPGAFNPEPLAPFIDFFVVGDGEEAIIEVAEALRATKGGSRRDRLAALSSLPGVYVPELRPVAMSEDGWLVPVEGMPKVSKRVVCDLDAARFPAKYLVPFAQQVHDRAGLEVMRGCTRGCRFCHAGMTSRPVRERSLSELSTTLDAVIQNTGFEEVSLLSLSTCDYSRVNELVQQAAIRAGAADVNVALPSLRVDPAAVGLADSLAGARRSSLTFAPEAGTARLRAVINKDVHEDALLDCAEEAYGRGWDHLKLYFMIGLPTEEDADVEAIADLCERVLERGRTVNPKARLHTGVSTFVPKPFTPFQWAAQIGIEEVQRRQSLLGNRLQRNRSIKYGRHNPKATFIEGLLCRGDRHTADLIEAAWRRGARFESSDEHIRWDAWTEALAETGFDIERALGPRDEDSPLPWDHIDALVSKAWLRDEWKRAREGVSSEDCRFGGCASCGVNRHVEEACARMRALHREKGASTPAVVDTQARHEPEPAQRLRFRIGRSGLARFLAHLELVNTWIRALRRAGAPLSHSQGFHAHAKVTFATAPPLGEESEGDLMDVILREHVEPGVLLAAVKGALPEGLHVFAVEEVPLRGPALMASTVGFTYQLLAESADPAMVTERAHNLIAAPEIWVEREGKPQASKGRSRKAGPVRVNVRPMIADLRVRQGDQTKVVIEARLQLADGRGVKPREVVALLGLDGKSTRICKRETHLRPDPDSGAAPPRDVS